MYKGIYIAASGAVLKQAQLEVLSQNIANANTTGYKKDTISFRDYLLQTGAGAEPDGRTMSDYSTVKTDLSAGMMVKTGNPLDIAVEGSGMIALDGGTYTRRGDFQKDDQGYLTTHDGIKVLGAGGPILLPTDLLDVSIDAEGKVSATTPGDTEPTEIDTIQVVEFGPDAALTRKGDGQFTSDKPGTPVTASIRQGYLESSNVEAVKEMVRMIESMREFESYQKAIQVFDQATAKVTGDMGRL